MIDARGQVMWTTSGLRPAANDTFTVAVPRVLIPAGLAHLRLYAQRGSRRELMHDVAVRFVFR
jgi:hypothetical protein